MVRCWEKHSRKKEQHVPRLGGRRLWDGEEEEPVDTLPNPSSLLCSRELPPLRSFTAESWGPHPRGHVTEDRIPTLLSFALAAAEPVDV